MPFIRGRYHINPVLGQALEAARQAELDHEPQAGGDDERDDYGGSGSSGVSRGPIKRVEIEAAQLVPSHSGRAHKGFVTRIHRESIDGQAGVSLAQGAAPGPQSEQAETRVFNNHLDLTDFLRNELGKSWSEK